MPSPVYDRLATGDAVTERAAAKMATILVSVNIARECVDGRERVCVDERVKERILDIVRDETLE